MFLLGRRRGDLSRELHKAARRGDHARVHRLIADSSMQDINPNWVDELGWSALHWSIFRNHAGVSYSLIHMPNIDVHLTTMDNRRTALHFAAYNGLASVVSHLLEKGASINIIDRGGYTPLHAAAAAGQLPVVKLLLEHLMQKSPQNYKPLLECTDKEFGRTPLQWAEVMQHLDVTMCLVEAARVDTGVIERVGNHPQADACMADRGTMENTQQEFQQPVHQLPVSPAPSIQYPWAASVATLGPANSLPQHWQSAAELTDRLRPHQSAPPSVASTMRTESQSSGSFVHVAQPFSRGTRSHASFTSSSSCFSRSSCTSTSTAGQPLKAWPAQRQIHSGTYWQEDQVSTASTPSSRLAPASPPSYTSKSRSGSTRQNLPPLQPLHNGALLQIQEPGGIVGAIKGAAGAAAMVVEPLVEAVGNPGSLVKGIFTIGQKLAAMEQNAVYCRWKVQRMRQRTAALLVCLKALPEQLAERLGEPYEAMLQNLYQVLENMYDLILKFSRTSDKLVARTMEFLRTWGFRQKFDVLDSELHKCSSDLMLIIQLANASEVKVQVPQALEELSEWPKQDKEDRAKDMQEVEGQMLGALGRHGPGVLPEEAVQRLEIKLQANRPPTSLLEVVTCLEQMEARHEFLSRHMLRQMDEIAVNTRRILEYLLPSQQAQDRQNLQPSVPILIPSSSIRFREQDMGVTMEGGSGHVLKGTRDRFTEVAIKVYRISQVGEIDREAAVSEAVQLCRVNHAHVVRCFGILQDENHATGARSLSGSLVMEWVNGGDMYRWLQRAVARAQVGLLDRIMLMLQVAAGMRHLHEQRLVHGDVKPQNMLLQFRSMQSGEAEPPTDEVPTVKICDFGLAKYNATAQSASAWTTSKCSPRYASPERLDPQHADRGRSFKDDVFAFGMLMYFAVTSQEPFSGESTEILVTGIILGKRPDIRAWAEDLQDTDVEWHALQYVQLAERCWDQDPASRPGFGEIFQALDRMLFPPDSFMAS